MWIHKLKMENIRAFDKADITFSKQINVIVGPNNAGKSTLLLPLLSLQKGLPHLQVSDVRLTKNGTVKIKISINNDDSYRDYYFTQKNAKIISYLYYESATKHTIPEEYLEFDDNYVCLSASAAKKVFKDALDTPIFTTKVNSMFANGSVVQRIGRVVQSHFEDIEKESLIYPFLAKRKVNTFDQTTNLKVVSTITTDFTHLHAKIDRVSSPTRIPAYDFFTHACDTVLGFRLGTGLTETGKQVVYTVRNSLEIPLTQMGEGVVNVLGLIADLSIAENKVFIIEEPENDIHPKALKALMDCIIKKSPNNQFIITTHSNIVLKRLGARSESKIFHVQSDFENCLPVSTVKEVPNTPEDRKCILQDLGYEIDDFDVWSGWLFLEESSAERIIREFLIPWFAPKLMQRLKTFSARSVSQVKPKFNDFNDLFVFVHLEPTYKDRAWVVIDGGIEEQKIIEELKANYQQWNPSHFINLSKHNFEEYYPYEFALDFTSRIVNKGKEEKRTQKRLLLDRVLGAIRENEAVMKAQFEVSAKEVIAILKDIEVALTTN